MIAMASAVVGTKRSFATMSGDGIAGIVSAHTSGHDAFASHLRNTVAEAACMTSILLLRGSLQLTSYSFKKLKRILYSTKHACTRDSTQWRRSSKLQSRCFYCLAWYAGNGEVDTGCDCIHCLPKTSSRHRCTLPGSNWLFYCKIPEAVRRSQPQLTARGAASEHIAVAR